MGSPFGDLFESVKTSFDLKGFETIGNTLIKNVTAASKEIADKIIADQKNLVAVLQRIQKGELDTVGGQRARDRYRRALDAHIQSLQNKATWESLQAWWKAEDKIIEWVGLIASGLLKLL